MFRGEIPDDKLNDEYWAEKSEMFTPLRTDRIASLSSIDFILINSLESFLLDESQNYMMELILYGSLTLCVCVLMKQSTNSWSRSAVGS